MFLCRSHRSDHDRGIEAQGDSMQHEPGYRYHGEPAVELANIQMGSRVASLPEHLHLAIGDVCDQQQCNSQPSSHYNALVLPSP